MTGGPADSLIARIASQRDLVQAMHEHCGLISARVTSRDGTVSVEVDRQQYLIEEFTRRLSELQHAPLTRRDGTMFHPHSVSNE